MSEAPPEDALTSQLDDFDYDLPSECIAQQPAKRRDEARLLVMDRGPADAAPDLHHQRVSDLPSMLRPGDLVVMNATRVLSAKLRGRKPTGGAVEALLLGECAEVAEGTQDGSGSGRFRALVRSAGRLRVGQKFVFAPATQEGDAETASARSLEAELVELGERGEVVLRFDPGVSPYSIGTPPLPPYIRRATGAAGEVSDDERYQTVFARVPGAIAAPTAGLHFTPELLAALKAGGIRCAEVVLHVGAGTFRPLSEADLAAGRLQAESYHLPPETVAAIAETRARGGRVVAVGTTTTRVLETCADASEGRAGVLAGEGQSELFLRPGSRFRVVDILLTNFHLPRSSLLLLVGAFAGREPILAAYREAIARGYRFYSYGDAMLIR